MVIKFLPVKYSSDDFLNLNFESLIEGQSAEWPIEGFLGEIWVPTHAVIKLSGILWIISMDEIKVELGGPLHPNDDPTLPAEWAFPKFTYAGSDQQLLQAARVDLIDQSPYFQALLKGQRDEQTN